MSTPNRSEWIGIAVALLVGATLASAQHNFTRTITVDPSGNADHQFIHNAIDDNRIGDHPSERYTILVYAGTYTIDSVAKLIELDDAKENVDLVGIDREAVIIDVTIGDAQNPRSGIKITSGSETSRNNRIADLTIKTTYGHGIKVVHGGTPVPKNITIEGVTIDANGTGMKGIEAEDVEALRVADVAIETGDGHGIEIFKDEATPTNITIEGVTIEAAGDGKHGIEGSAGDTVAIFNCKIEAANGNALNVGDNYELSSSILTSKATGVGREALVSDSKDGLLVTNCTLKADGRGLYITGVPPSKNIQVVASEIRGALEGMMISPAGANIRFRDCYIVADGDSSTNAIRAIYLDFNYPTSDVVFQGCRVEALGGDATTQVYCLLIDNVDKTRLVDCDLRAVCRNEDAQAIVEGIRCPTPTVFVMGGSIETSQPNFDKAISVFDLRGDVDQQPSPGHIFVSGTRFSKWVGPINAAGRPRSLVQRMLNVAQADPAKLADSADLDGVPIHPGLAGVLGTYRALKVTWNNASGDDITITVSGINWAGDDIAEEFELSVGSPAKEGSKPFKIVATIYIPDAPGTISVGTTNKLGLYYPISADSDVLQEARLVNGVYTSQTVGTVDEVYSTVIPSTITAADSFEWAVLASQ